ncbi:Protein of unknown function [Thermosyntropha lipolytica DSM 11003]|uniref:DUF2953 domain-containing protein n=1 Tax=Thermosyntropha lipolytica DSM 11003 TaxID=1123382 RepID=A0A1M5P8I1_9FIRM|nr:DUF2953 domain-containing protein [Thermosyntropha lipolytica]SHG98007.1 Protein of unknown function [Thermosyntropha lipolytica DSM 11003]
MWYVCISFLVFLLLLMMPVKLYISIKLEVESDEVKLGLQVKLGIWWKKEFAYRLSLYSIDQFIFADPGFKKRKRFPAGYFKNLYRPLLSFISIEKLDWETMWGTDDAAHTAWAVGGWWIIKGILLGFLRSQMRIKKIYISIKPDFVHESKKSELFCIVRLTMVHIMLIGICSLLAKQEV